MRRFTVVIASLGTVIAFFCGMTHALTVQQDPAPKTMPKAESTDGADRKLLEAEIAARRTKQLEYEGTEIKLSAMSDGDDLTMRQFANAMNSKDPLPPKRRSEFDWYYTSMPNLRVIGWQGVITRASPFDDGWIVEIRVSPRLAGVGAFTSTNDYCNETWKFTKNGDLELQRCERQKDRPALLFGD